MNSDLIMIIFSSIIAIGGLICIIWVWSQCSKQEKFMKKEKLKNQKKFRLER